METDPLMTDQLLKDVTAAADICRCNPCRCDPLLNDCSVSCNPIVEESKKEPEASSKSSCCGSGPKKPSSSGGCCGSIDKKPAPSGGCGCRCGQPAVNNDPVPVEPVPPPSLDHCHSEEAPSCSQSNSDPDPCCIVVCLKHLKRQYLMDRPKCCA